MYSIRSIGCIPWRNRASTVEPIKIEQADTEREDPLVFERRVAAAMVAAAEADLEAANRGETGRILALDAAWWVLRGTAKQWLLIANPERARERLNKLQGKAIAVLASMHEPTPHDEAALIQAMSSPKLRAAGGSRRRLACVA